MNAPNVANAATLQASTSPGSTRDGMDQRALLVRVGATRPVDVERRRRATRPSTVRSRRARQRPTANSPAYMNAWAKSSSAEQPFAEDRPDAEPAEDGDGEVARALGSTRRAATGRRSAWPRRRTPLLRRCPSRRAGRAAARVETRGRTALHRRRRAARRRPSDARRPYRSAIRPTSGRHGDRRDGEHGHGQADAELAGTERALDEQRDDRNQDADVHEEDQRDRRHEDERARDQTCPVRAPRRRELTPSPSWRDRTPGSTTGFRR